MKSERSSRKRAWSWSARARCSTGRSRGSWIDSAAATTSTSRRQPSRSASRIIRPSRGSIGSRASRRPIVVSRLRVRAPGAQRAQLLEQLDAGAHVALVGRVDEREPADVAEAQRRHLEDHAGQVGAEDLRVGELRSGEVVLLGVQPDRDAVGHASAASGPLVGRGLADRLDREPLHLGAQRVARDAGDAGVDDVADARHGQRGLGDVRGQHHPAPGVLREHPVLLGRGEPREQRQDVEAAPAGPAIELVDLLQRVLGVPDLALAGQEHQHVAVALPAQLADRVDDRLRLVAYDGLALVVVVRLLDQRPVADLDRVGAPGDLDDRRVRRSAARTAPGRSSRT